MSSQSGFSDDIAEELITRARGLQPYLLETAPLSERNRRLSDEIIGRLAAARLFDVCVPRRWGGQCVSATTMSRIALELAKGCPSTGWVFCISNSNAWVGSLGPDAVQEAVFADGVPIMCGAVNPPGSFQKVDGGIRITGSWPYCSGCYHSSWTMFGLGARDEQGHFVPGGQVFIPMTGVTIEDTWHVAGLKATGSCTCVAKDLFVPDHLRAMPDQMGPFVPGKKHVGDPTDYFPLLPHLRSVILGVLVGMAEAVLERVASGAKNKGIVYTTYLRQADSHVAQKEVGEAGAMINAARILMTHATEMVDRVALSRKPMDYMDQTRNRSETSMATDLLVKAVEKLMYVAGSGAFMERNDAQRFWRDLNVAARHAANIPHIGYEIYGRALMGVEPNIAPHPSFI
jgi:3-hydroxy-9,10-secoandrosta-1,3,5(10)-triene-9,17-dione monooxygenase